MASTPTAVHQFVPSLAWGDAVGNIARSWQAAFRSWDYTSEIFAGQTDERSRSEARPASEYPEAADARTVLLFHHCIESGQLPMLRRAPGRKAVVYHNITPAHFFEGQDRRLAQMCRAARRELYELASLAERGYAFSRYSAEELTAAGFSEVQRVPVVIDWSRFDVEPDPALRAELGDGCFNVLFVGRAVPNKGLDDVLRAFTAYQRLYNPRSRLVIAGELVDSPYVAYVRALLAQLKPERVLLLGRVTQAQLSACYATASAYLSMSRHEGLGVPLVECMHRGVPVVAYGAAAVPETLDGAGITTLSRDPLEVAKLLAVLDRTPHARERIVAHERERAADFDPEKTVPELRAALAPLLQLPPIKEASFPPDQPAVLIVCPGLDANPEAPLSVAARSLALQLAANADVELLTLKAEGRPEGNGPEVAREGLVTVLKYTPEEPLQPGERELPLSSSLQSAVLATGGPVILFGSDQPNARELVPQVAARAFAVDPPGAPPSEAARELGPRHHVAPSEDALEDAVTSVAAQVLARVEKGDRS